MWRVVLGDGRRGVPQRCVRAVPPIILAFGCLTLHESHIARQTRPSLLFHYPLVPRLCPMGGTSSLVPRLCPMMRDRIIG